MRRRTKIILAVMGVAIVWQFAQIGLIAAQARYFANGRPYCMEASGGCFGRYRPVVSLLELNGFNLSNAGLGRPECQPQADFVLKLPVLAHR